jgi:enoyl-CoA hydratase/carnithine racemase
VASPVLFETRDGCLDVILNRPDEGNLITNEMGGEIARTLRAVGPDIKLIRVRGNGAHFSKGRQAPKIDRATMTTLDVRYHIAEVPLELYGAVKEARAPTLAIVQGEALGVGCALAAVCDMTLAADDAVFQVPELEHNIAPTLVMWAFLNRVPYKTAAYLVYSREKISAQRAEALSLVTKVVPAASLAGEAEAFSQNLLSRRVTALRGIKEFLTNSSRMDPVSAVAYSSALNATLMTSAPPPPSEPHR